MTDPIADRVETFLGELAQLVRAIALEAAAAALGGPVPVPAASASPSAPRAPRRPPQPPARLSPPRPAPAPPAAPSEPSSAEPTASERDERVLAAVRALVRVTVDDVVAHTGLGNGSVAVALRVLAGRNLVARTKSVQRGTEYSLISPGPVRPFKRTKTIAVAAPPPA